MIVTSLRNGSSGARLVCERSKSLPVLAGAQRFFSVPILVLPAHPWTISMATRRTFGRAAADADAEKRPAGVIASSTGSATPTPIPFRTVRRESRFFVRNSMSPLPPGLLLNVVGHDGLRLRHLERRAVDDSEHERRELVVVLRGLPDDRANSRLIEILDPAAEGVRHQAIGEIPNHRLGESGREHLP